MAKFMKQMAHLAPRRDTRGSPLLNTPLPSRKPRSLPDPSLYPDPDPDPPPFSSFLDPPSRPPSVDVFSFLLYLDRPPSLSRSLILLPKRATFQNNQMILSKYKTKGRFQLHQRSTINLGPPPPRLPSACPSALRGQRLGGCRSPSPTRPPHY